jgi:type VI protein secretion system component VasF
MLQDKGKIVSSTNIEKTNLEAHVELCAERYDYLHDKLETLDSRMDTIESTLGELKDLVTDMHDRRQGQMINWGIAIIGTLITAVAFLVYNLITANSTIVRGS